MTVTPLVGVGAEAVGVLGDAAEVHPARRPNTYIDSVAEFPKDVHRGGFSGRIRDIACIE